MELFEFMVRRHDRKNGVHRQGPAEILADRFADTLNRRDLETVRKHCRDDGMAVSSINVYVGKLGAALNWCVEQDLFHENPWGKYRQLPGAKNRPRSGTPEDFRKLYPALPPWLQWGAKTAIALCLRPEVSELFRLKWSAFDWRSGSVTAHMPKGDSAKLVFPPENYLADAWTRCRTDTTAGLS